MKITENFSLEELIISETAKKRGINNTPSEEITNNLIKLTEEVLQPIRDKYGKSIKVTSGYRSPELNKAIGGAKTSQHLTGEAADLKAGDGNNKKLFDLILEMINKGEITVGQCIWEYGTKQQPRWIHVSLPNFKHKNQILYLL